MHQVIPGTYKPYQDILCTTCGVKWSANRNKAGWEYDCTQFVREHEGHNLLVRDMEAESMAGKDPTSAMTPWVPKNVYR